MSTTEDIRAQFDIWAEALLTQDPQSVVSLYAPDAVLLPTLSNQVRHNHAEITGYFDMFCALKPVATMVESNIRVFGDAGTNSGIYSFNLDAPDGSRVDVLVRFTFTYERQRSPAPDDNEWLIVAHHSSAMPENT